MILFFKLNETRNTTDLFKLTSVISLIFIGFVILQFIAGSKAAFLMILSLLVLYTLSMSREYPGSKILFPQPKLFLLFLLLSPPLFYFALIQRINLSGGVSPDLDTLLTGISTLETNTAYDISKEILYRFSQGGLDRFILIFQSFIIDGFHLSTATEFMNYLAKNTVNLLLPGTPFPESYAPSSQLFTQVIQKNIIGWSGGIDQNALIKKLNTQPYTIFGVFTVVFGISAPVFMYLCTVFFTFIFNCINNVFMRITMLYFFASGLVSFGIEVVLGNSVHVLVSIFIMYFMLKIMSCVKFKAPSKLLYLSLPGSK